MPVFFDQNLRLAFVHIPRTGGTFIETVLRQAGPLRFFGNGIREAMRITPQHMTMDDLKYLFGPSFFTHSIAVIRDPLDRIKSVYALRRKHMAQNSFGVPDFDTWVPAQFEHARSNPCHLDNHLRPQSHFIADETRVFRFENGLSPVVDHLSEVIGHSFEPPKDRLMQSNSAIVTASAATRAMIADFYRIDYDLYYDGARP